MSGIDHTQATDTTSSMISSLSYTDFLLIGGITFLAYYIYRSRRAPPSQVVNLKTLKVLPSIADESPKESQQEKSLIEKMKATGKTLVIFFGSQTGTAEEFARRLAKNARLYGIKAIVVDPEEVDTAELAKLHEVQKALAVFVIATYGEGDPTDNAQQLVDFLRQDDVNLGGIKYAVFGLGNKTYEHYNEIGKFVDKRLEEINANRLVPLGLGDDDGNIEEDFVTWMDKFWPAVCEYQGISNMEQDISMRQYQMQTHDNLPPEKVFKGDITRLNSYIKQRPPFDAKNPFLAPVIVNKQLFKGGERQCLHIEFDITGSRLRYEAGDHVAIYPANDAELVTQIGELLGVDLDTVMSLTSIEEDAAKKNPFPCPTTFRTALTYYLDITSLPTTQFIKEVAQYATDAEDKKLLQLMCSPSEEGKKAYNLHIREYHRDLVGFLQWMKSLKPPIDHVLELLPRLQVRYYSISSSPKLYPNSIHITCTVIEYKTKEGRTCKGVCTNWLAGKLPVGEEKPRVPIYVRKSQFRLPFKFQTPIIMIGPGTGLAPFRGFIQERDFFRREGRQVGPSILYYGCRNQLVDYLYPEELKEYFDNGTLTHLNVAFSRDQETKVYVTHHLQRDAHRVYELLCKENGHLYVCGDAKNMARDVNEILINVCKTEGNMTQAQATQFIKELSQKSRYVLDVWS